MMRKSRHLLCAALVLCLLMSLAPMTALAVNVDVPDVSMPAAEGIADNSTISAVIGDAAVTIGDGAENAQVAEDLGPGDPIEGDLYPSHFLGKDSCIQELYEALRLRKNEIYLYYCTGEVLTEADLDELFLTAAQYGFDADGGDYLLCSVADYGYYADVIQDGGLNYYIIGYAVAYFTTLEQEQALSAKIEELRESIIGDAVNEYQKIKAIHDYIVQNVEVDLENAENVEDLSVHSAYAALMNGKATAQAYPMLFHRMAKQYGIGSRIIIGTVQGEVFMWNIVRCNDVWYNVNIIANDMDSTDAYFMKGSTDFPDGHQPADMYLTEEFKNSHPMSETALNPEKELSGKAGKNVEWYYNALTNEIHVVGSGRMMDDPQIFRVQAAAPKLIVEDGVTYIGRYAFSGFEFAEVVIADSVTEIGSYAFDGSSINKITLNEGLKKIGDNAFSNCSNLTEVKLPSTVESIGAAAFYGLPIVKAEISANVKNIGVNAFDYENFEGYVVDEKNPNFSSENGVLYNKDKTALLATPVVMKGTFAIPETVTTIGEGAFYGRTWCTSLKLPEGITKLGKDAFRNSGLVVIQLPSTLTEIPEGAFATDNLSGILIPDSIVSIGTNAFACTYLYNIHYAGTMEEWNKIDIAEDNFALNIAQIHEKSITISAYGWTLDLTTGEFIAEYFNNGLSWGPWKDAITSVKMYGYATHVPEGGFKDCGNLKTVYIDLYDLNIGKDAFAGCSALTDVYYCETEIKWEEYGFAKAFVDAPNLTVHFKEVVTSGPVGDNLQWSFDERTRTLTISGQGVMCDFEQYGRPWDAWMWGNDPINVVIEEGVTAVGAYFMKQTSIEMNLKLPSTVERIGYEAFADCRIEKLEFGKGLKLIEDMAFRGCEIAGYYDAENNKWYSTLVLPEGVTDVGRRAFFNANWSDVYVPASVKNIGEYAFCGNNDTKLHYGGTKAQWKQVYVHPENMDWQKTPAYYSASCPHMIEKRAQVNATCYASGLTEGTYCAACGVVIQEQQVIEKLPHTYENDVCTVCGEEKPPESPFTDVMYTDWFFNPVLWAVNSNVTGGIGNGQFGPNNFCTRAQVVTFLYAAAGKPEVTTTENPFEDVADDAWYLKPVLWAVENGITGGTSPTTFGPDNYCTRAQVVTFLYAAAGKPEITASSTFTDVADTDWYAKPVIWAKENDVTGGISATEFGPNQTCTRAQVVTFLYKVYG